MMNRRSYVRVVDVGDDDGGVDGGGDGSGSGE